MGASPLPFAPPSHRQTPRHFPLDVGERLAIDECGELVTAVAAVGEDVGEEELGDVHVVIFAVSEKGIMLSTHAAALPAREYRPTG